MIKPQKILSVDMVEEKCKKAKSFEFERYQDYVFM